MATYIIAISSVFFIVLAIALVDWRKMAEKWVGFDPAKAMVYVRSGEHEDNCKGKLIYAAQLGAFYSYKWRKVELVVAVESDYPFVEIHGRRKINVLAGHAVGVREFWDRIGDRKTGLASSEAKLFNEAGAAAVALEKSLNTQSAYDLNALVKSHIAENIVNSLFGSKVKTWVVIIGIIAVAVVGYMLMQQFVKPETGMPVNNTAITTTPAQSTGTIVPGAK